MVPDVTAPVERFHRVLVDEIRKQRPDYLQTSFPLSEIYQRLVPYRSHRDALGLDMNGDYEAVLLRLLAGAGDLVILESQEARELIRRELDSKNPNTGLFREFAATEVRLGIDDMTVMDADVRSPRGTDELVTVSDAAVSDAAVSDAAAGEPETAAAESEPVQLDAAETEPVDGLTALIETVAEPVDEAVRSNGTYFDFESTGVDAVELEPALPDRSVSSDVVEDVVEEVDALEAALDVDAPAAETPTDHGVEAASEAASEADSEADSEDGVGVMEGVDTETADAEALDIEAAEVEIAEVVSVVVDAPDADTTEEQTSAATAEGARNSGQTTEETVAMTQGDCGWCGDGLPDRAEVNFCPHCGKTTSLKPCRECGDEMELGWRFCVRCGTASTAGATAGA